MSATIAIAVVDDHMVVQDGVRAMTEREDDLEYRGGATSPEEALALVPRWAPDVLLLDLRIGRADGFRLCRQLRERIPDLGILIFSAFGNAELLAEGIRAGANGYVLKDTSTSRLPTIIREFREVGSYFDPRVAGRVLVDALGGEQRPAEAPAFSQRELDIIRLIARGDSNHEIGRELDLSPHTVKFHITRMLRRLNLRRRAELVRVAMDRQLMP